MKFLYYFESFILIEFYFLILIYLKIFFDFDFYNYSKLNPEKSYSLIFDLLLSLIKFLELQCKHSIF